MSEATSAYRGVIADLRGKIAVHQQAIEDLKTAIKVVMNNAPSETVELETLPNPTNQSRFDGLSLRKAILIYLLDEPSRAQETGVISEALQSGGMTTKGQSFTSNVSATLSDMAKKWGEVEKIGTAWKLTVTGLAAAEGRPANHIPINTDGPTFRANEQRRLLPQ